jgi:small basic protein (TIGR04137 family)
MKLNAMHLSLRPAGDHPAPSAGQSDRKGPSIIHPHPASDKTAASSGPEPTTSISPGRSPNPDGGPRFWGLAGKYVSAKPAGEAHFSAKKGSPLPRPGPGPPFTTQPIALKVLVSPGLDNFLAGHNLFSPVIGSVQGSRSPCPLWTEGDGQSVRTREEAMSIDKSLRKKGSLVRARNVLKRFERIEKLKEMDRWTEESAPFNLPKVRVQKLAAKKAVKKEEKAEAGKDAKPAKGGKK